MPTAEQIAKRIAYQEIAEVPVSTRDMLAAHIAIAIKEEREECAKAAEALEQTWGYLGGAFQLLAKAIRARSNLST